MHIHTIIQLDCHELSPPSSGTIDSIKYSNNQTIGSTATYLNFQCNVGFEQRGELVRRCTENGWEGLTPYCSELASSYWSISACAYHSWWQGNMRPLDDVRLIESKILAPPIVNTFAIRRALDRSST